MTGQQVTRTGLSGRPAAWLAGGSKGPRGRAAVTQPPAPSYISSARVANAIFLGNDLPDSTSSDTRGVWLDPPRARGGRVRGRTGSEDGHGPSRALLAADDPMGADQAADGRSRHMCGPVGVGGGGRGDATRLSFIKPSPPTAFPPPRTVEFLSVRRRRVGPSAPAPAAPPRPSHSRPSRHGEGREWGGEGSDVRRPWRLPTPLAHSSRTSSASSSR